MTDRISLLIQAKNLSAAQFADEIGVQRSSISHLVSGRNKPSLDLIQKTLQRFPEVSTEWLLFGKGEMVRELNLFDSHARSGGLQSNGKLLFETGPELQNHESGPTLFTDEMRETARPVEVNEVKNTSDALNMATERTATPVSGLAEKQGVNAKVTEPGEGLIHALNLKNNKKECAIEKIIVFYDDRTFIAYSPGN